MDYSTDQSIRLSTLLPVLIDLLLRLSVLVL
jgi:hypothetical protein